MNKPTASGKILHVLYAPVIGGCESLCFDLVEHWHPRGKPQAVAFLSAETGPLSERLGCFADVATFVCLYERKARYRFVKRFAALCRRERFGTVIIYCFGLHFFIALGARLGGARNVFALIQNPPPQNLRRRLTTGLLAQLARPWVNKEWVCSRYVQRKVSRWYGLPARRLELVPNWCNVDSITRRAQSAKPNRCMDRPIITMVARMDRIKNHRLVIAAFARFHGRYPNARLRLIGDGPERSALERFASQLRLNSQVEFLGSRSDVPEQLGESDIFVYATTAEEGFAIVLAEAMAAGLPIVATDIGPCSEVLDGGRAGTLVPNDSADALADALCDLWATPAKRQALISAAAATAHSRYSIVSAAHRIERYLA